MKKVLLLLLLMPFVVGCATQRVDMTGRSKAELGPPDYKEWSHFFVFQLVPDKQTVNAAEICAPESVARVETEQTFVNGVVRFLTAPVYGPREVRIWCTGSRSELSSASVSPAPGGKGGNHDVSYQNVEVPPE